MSDTFTASNGLYVFRAEEYLEAFREFFQWKRDEELGRVRWPDDPDFVIYPRPEYDVVTVLNEHLGTISEVTRTNADKHGGDDYLNAAAWWFDQNPAMCGETLMVEGQPVACRGRLGHAGDHGHESDGLFLTWADTEAAE